MAKPKKQPRRLTGNIPDYSPCCDQPVLTRPGQFYCDGCREIIADFSGKHRGKALAELRWERTWPTCLSLMWRNRRVACAVWVPHYSMCLKKIERITYEWVIGTSSNDFSRIGKVLGLDLPFAFGHPSRGDFETLEDAARDLYAVLLPLAAPFSLPSPLPLPPFVEKEVAE